jgi:hypothetical protein
MLAMIWETSKDKMQREKNHWKVKTWRIWVHSLPCCKNNVTPWLSSLAIRGSCIQILALACPSFLVLDMTRRGACNVHQWQDFKTWLKVWLRLLFKMFFMLKYIKMIFFLFFKKLFLKSTHQNDPKHIKKLIFYGTRFTPRFQRCLNPSL